MERDLPPPTTGGFSLADNPNLRVVPMTSSQPEQEPMFDEYGIQLDETLPNYDLKDVLEEMNRLARLQSNDMYQFVAEVAAKTGVATHKFIVNDSLFDLKSRSVEHAIRRSDTDMKTAIVLLAAAVTTLFKEEDRKRSKEEEEEEDVGVEPVVQTPQGKPPTPASVARGRPLGFPIHDNTWVSTHIQSTLQLIGAPENGNEEEQHPRDLLSEVQRVLKSFSSVTYADDRMWMEAHSPENTGLLQLEPQLLAMIRDALTRVKRLSGLRDLTLPHLLRSPDVRHHFASFVAALLNTVPGVNIYPMFMNAGRGITGARISNGAIKQRSLNNVVRAGEQYFRHVALVKNPEFKELQKRLGILQGKRDGLKTTLNQTLRVMTAFQQLMLDGLNDGIGMVYDPEGTLRDIDFEEVLNLSAQRVALELARKRLEEQHRIRPVDDYLGQFRVLNERLKDNREKGRQFVLRLQNANIAFVGPVPVDLLLEFYVLNEVLMDKMPQQDVGYLTATVDRLYNLLRVLPSRIPLIIQQGDENFRRYQDQVRKTWIALHAYMDNEKMIEATKRRLDHFNRWGDAWKRVVVHQEEDPGVKRRKLLLQYSLATLPGEYMV